MHIAVDAQQLRQDLRTAEGTQVTTSLLAPARGRGDCGRQRPGVVRHLEKQRLGSRNRASAGLGIRSAGGRRPRPRNLPPGRVRHAPYRVRQDLARQTQSFRHGEQLI